MKELILLTCAAKPLFTSGRCEFESVCRHHNIKEVAFVSPSGGDVFSLLSVTVKMPKINEKKVAAYEPYSLQCNTSECILDCQAKAAHPDITFKQIYIKTSTQESFHENCVCVLVDCHT